MDPGQNDPGDFTRLDLTDMNRQIRDPSNPNGEISSLLDPNEKLSYSRWSVSIVCGRNSPHDEQSDGLSLAFSDRPRIVIEKVTRSGGYQLLEAEVKENGPAIFEDQRRLARFGIPANLRRTLEAVNTGFRGPLFRNAEDIEPMIEFFMGKFSETQEVERLVLREEPINNPPRFDMSNPDPENNIFNHVTFVQAVIRAGGLEFTDF